MQSRLICLKNSSINPNKILHVYLIPIRNSSGVVTERPPPSLIKFVPPPHEKGYFRYERDFSGDHRYSKPIIPGCTFRRVFEHSLHDVSLYPLYSLVVLSLGLVALFGIPAFFKMEVWIDRTKRDSPYDWERSKDNYWKWWTTWLDPFHSGPSHSRLYIMEDINNAMLDEAKKRGTR